LRALPVVGSIEIGSVVSPPSVTDLRSLIDRIASARAAVIAHAADRAARQREVGLGLRRRRRGPPRARARRRGCES
jgi:putative N-acetylmannosamine-6-phosphate epimerase